MHKRRELALNENINIQHSSISSLQNISECSIIKRSDSDSGLITQKRRILFVIEIPIYEIKQLNKRVFSFYYSMIFLALFFIIYFLFSSFYFECKNISESTRISFSSLIHNPGSFSQYITNFNEKTEVLTQQSFFVYTNIYSIQNQVIEKCYITYDMCYKNYTCIDSNLLYLKLEDKNLISSFYNWCPEPSNNNTSFANIEVIQDLKVRITQHDSGEGTFSSFYSTEFILLSILNITQQNFIDILNKESNFLVLNSIENKNFYSSKKYTTISVPIISSTLVQKKSTKGIFTLQKRDLKIFKGFVFFFYNNQEFLEIDWVKVVFFLIGNLYLFFIVKERIVKYFFR